MVQLNNNRGEETHRKWYSIAFVFHHSYTSKEKQQKKECSPALLIFPSFASSRLSRFNYVTEKDYENGKNSSNVINAPIRGNCLTKAQDLLTVQKHYI